ncbi:adenosylcobinamide-GDP ribazoletransferase [Clostridium tertium]|uniref:Adenosylcobinamide-GDP ribazoletransferase n=1 Tax=Clostridium tertium TaxID=1559 RepID=A0A6N3FE34_9CLOT
MKNLIKGFIMDITMFTILPMPYKVWEDNAVCHMMKLYPIIGLIVGSVNYLVYIIANYFNLPLIIISALTMIAPFIITGMLHLDGFMDVCDALLSRRDKKEKIRILKDPNTGAFSVISLGILFIINFSSVYSIIEGNENIIGIIIIPIISRALMGYMLLKKDTMKESSLGSYFKTGTGKIDIVVLNFLLLLALIALIFLFGISGIILGGCIILSAIISVNKSIKELGGMSGDIAGYGLVISEAVGLFILAVI